MKKLLKALAILTSFSVLTRALGFLFRIFLSRTLSTQDLGIYQISFSVFMVLETIVSSGIPLVVSKLTSKYNAENNKKSEFSLLTSAIIIGIITSLFVCVFVTIFKNLFSLIFTDQRCLSIILVLLPSLVFSSVYATIRGNLWGHKKYFLVSFTEFLEQLIRIAFCVLFLGLFNFFTDKIMAAIYSYVFSCLVSALVVLIIYFKNNGRFAKPQKGQFKEILRFSTPITSIRIVSSLLTPLISLIIPMQLVKIGLSSQQALSLYGIAMGMTFPLLYVPSTLAGSLSMTLVPEISCHIAQNNYNEISNKVHFSIKFGVFISFLFIPIFLAIGKYIGIFIFANHQSGVFLSYSSFLIIPICLSGITVSCLNALNLEVKSFINYIFGAMFLIFCIFYLTRYLNIFSLILGMGLCLSVATLLNITLLNKKLTQNFFNLSYFLKTILASIPAFLICKWSFNVFYKFLPLFFSIAFSSCLAEIFFLILALILNLYNLSFLKQGKKHWIYHKNK